MRMPMHLNSTPSAARHGVTLIEVMMSTMVVSLGILGLVALVPLGTHLTERGTRADRIAINGERAFHEARIRGYFDPQRWVNATTATISSTTGGVAPLPLRQPYMIDPLFFGTGNTDVSRRFFPYKGTPVYGQTMTDAQRQHRDTNKPMQMFRLSVSPLPGNTTPLSIPEARIAFESDDDLSFERPSDGEASPFQRFYQRSGAVDASTNVNGDVRRQADGEYSWMIMLTPEPFDLQRVSYVTSGLNQQQVAWLQPPINTSASVSGGTTELIPTLNAAATKEYVASVLILKNRTGVIPQGAVPATISNTSDELWQTNERILNVVTGSFISGSGASTGEIQLIQNGGTLEDAEERTLKIRNGDWICLAGRIPLTSLSADLPMGDVYRWYKVVMVDEVVDEGSNIYTRRLTLNGPDWPVTSHLPTHAIMVEGVVGVYTRNVRLESQSPWSP